MLPCRHIFHVRQKLGLSLYDQNLCAERWTSAYSRVQRNATVFNESSGVNQYELEGGVIVSSQNQKKKLTSQQKYSRGMTLWKTIANAISLSSQEQFDHKIDQLSTLCNAWNEGKEIGIQVFTSELENQAVTVDGDEIEGIHLPSIETIEASNVEIPSDLFDNEPEPVQGISCPSIETVVVTGIETPRESSNIDPLDRILSRLTSLEEDRRSNVIDQGVMNAISSSIAGLLYHFVRPSPDNH